MIKKEKKRLTHIYHDRNQIQYITEWKIKCNTSGHHNEGAQQWEQQCGGSLMYK